MQHLTHMELVSKHPNIHNKFKNKKLSLVAGYALKFDYTGNKVNNLVLKVIKANC